MINIVEFIKRHRWIAILLVIQASVFSFLHLYGVYKKPVDKFFTGQFIPANDQGYEMCDNCFYLGWGYKQAMDGHFLLEDKFQGYDTKRNVFHFWWIFGGHFARIVGLDLITFNWLQRVFCGLLLSIGIYRMGVDIWRSAGWATIAAAFYVFSSFSGYPWPEGCVFVANSAEVVLPMANALMVMLFYLTYRFFVQRKGNLYLLSFMTLMLEMDYPYGIILYSFATGLLLLFLLYRKEYSLKELLRSFVILMTPAYIIVGYNYYLVYNDYRLVDCQAQVSSPDYWTLFKGYFPLSLTALIGLYLTFRKPKEVSITNYYLLFWFIGTLTLIYVPRSIIPFQMEMIVGIHLPLAFFTIEALRRIREKGLVMMLTIVIFVMSVYPNALLYSKVMEVIDDGARPSYIENVHFDAMQWLDANSKGSDQVLAMNYIASYVPMLTGNRIYIGEYKLISAYFDERQRLFDEALDDPTGLAMTKFLEEQKIDYVFYCDRMQEKDRSGLLSKAIQQGGKYSVAFSNEGVRLIRVEHND